jgi:hypothetical protein
MSPTRKRTRSQTAAAIPTFDDLPEEVLHKILGTMVWHDAGRSACVCKRWRAYFELHDETPTFRTGIIRDMRDFERLKTPARPDLCMFYVSEGAARARRWPKPGGYMDEIHVWGPWRKSWRKGEYRFDQIGNILSAMLPASCPVVGAVVPGVVCTDPRYPGGCVEDEGVDESGKKSDVMAAVVIHLPRDQRIRVCENILMNRGDYENWQTSEELALAKANRKAFDDLWYRDRTEWSKGKDAASDPLPGLFILTDNMDELEEYGLRKERNVPIDFDVERTIWRTQYEERMPSHTIGGVVTQEEGYEGELYIRREGSGTGFVVSEALAFVLFPGEFSGHHTIYPMSAKGNEPLSNKHGESKTDESERAPYFSVTCCYFDNVDQSRLCLAGIKDKDGNYVESHELDEYLRGGAIGIRAPDAGAMLERLGPEHDQRIGAYEIVEDFEFIQPFFLTQGPPSMGVPPPSGTNYPGIDIPWPAWYDRDRERGVPFNGHVNGAAFTDEKLRAGKYPTLQFFAKDPDASRKELKKSCEVVKRRIRTCHDSAVHGGWARGSVDGAARDGIHRWSGIALDERKKFDPTPTPPAHMRKEFFTRRPAHYPALGAFAVICVGRGKEFYGEKNVDTGIIRESFPDLPVFGFFANGELGPAPGCEIASSAPHMSKGMAYSTVVGVLAPAGVRPERLESMEARDRGGGADGPWDGANGDIDRGPLCRFCSNYTEDPGYVPGSETCECRRFN